jgi:hypothetical protein
MKNHPILSCLILAALIFILCWSLLEGLDRQAVRLGQATIETMQDGQDRNAGKYTIVKPAKGNVLVTKEER